MSEDQKARIIKYYLQGKSYDDLLIAIKNLKLDGGKLMLKEIHSKFQHKRERIAKRDLWIAIISLIALCVNVVLLFAGFTFGLQIHVSVILFFVWIPFFRSYWTVQRSKEKFDGLETID